MYARDCVRAKKDDAIVESTNSPISSPGRSDNVIALRSRSDHLRAHFHAGNSRFSRSKQSPARCTSIGEQTGSTRSFARPAVLCCIHKSSSARPENIQNGRRRRRRRVYLRLRRERKGSRKKSTSGKLLIAARESARSKDVGVCFAKYLFLSLQFVSHTHVLKCVRGAVKVVVAQLNFFFCSRLRTF